MNQANFSIEQSRPYTVRVKVKGVAKMLLHCWQNEAIEEKAKAKKGSDIKKTDNLESYVERVKNPENPDFGKIVMPTLNLCAGIACAAKSYTDKAAGKGKTMYSRVRACVVPGSEYGVINEGKEKRDENGNHTWDFVDSRRAVINRAGITRSRPAFNEGWEITFDLLVLEPEYVSFEMLYTLVSDAGKFQAIGDFRPTFGRFRIESMAKIED